MSKRYPERKGLQIAKGTAMKARAVGGFASMERTTAADDQAVPCNSACSPTRWHSTPGGSSGSASTTDTNSSGGMVMPNADGGDARVTKEAPTLAIELINNAY